MAHNAKPRGTVHVGQPGNHLLFNWARSLHLAFGVGPILVGSAAVAKGWRDVDLRLVLPDDEFRVKVGSTVDYTDARRASMNVAYSFWGQQMTGLPIDFQFQPEGEARDYSDKPFVRLATFYMYRDIPKGSGA